MRRGCMGEAVNPVLREFRLDKWVWVKIKAQGPQILVPVSISQAPAKRCKGVNTEDHGHALADTFSQ